MNMNWLLIVVVLGLGIKSFYCGTEEDGLTEHHKQKRSDRPTDVLKNFSLCRCINKGRNDRNTNKSTKISKEQLLATFEMTLHSEIGVEYPGKMLSIVKPLCVKFAMKEKPQLNHVTVKAVYLMGVASRSSSNSTAKDGMPWGKWRLGNDCECKSAMANTTNLIDMHGGKRLGDNYQTLQCPFIKGHEDGFPEPDLEDKSYPGIFHSYVEMRHRGAYFVAIFDPDRVYTGKTTEIPQRIQIRALVQFRAFDTTSSYTKIWSNQLSIKSDPKGIITSFVDKDFVAEALELNQDYFDQAQQPKDYFDHKECVDDVFNQPFPPRSSKNISLQFCLNCGKMDPFTSKTKEALLVEDGIDVDNCFRLRVSRTNQSNIAVIFKCHRTFTIDWFIFVAVNQFTFPYGKMTPAFTEKINSTEFGFILPPNDSNSTLVKCPYDRIKDKFGDWVYEKENPRFSFLQAEDDGPPTMLVVQPPLLIVKKDVLMAIATFIPPIDSEHRKRQNTYQIIITVFGSRKSDTKPFVLHMGSEEVFSKDINSDVFQPVSCREGGIKFAQSRDYFFGLMETYKQEHAGACRLFFPPTAKPTRATTTKKPRRPTSRKSTTTAKPNVVVKDIVYEGCNQQKGCIGPNDAEESCLRVKSCDIVVVYGGDEHPDVRRRKDEIIVEIYGDAEKWVALGFSSDDLMGDDYIIECILSEREITLHTSWNYGYENVRQRGEQGPNGIIRLVHAVRDGSAIYCKFYIKDEFERKPANQNKTYKYNLLATEYHILMATGDRLIEEKRGTTKGNLLKHDRMSGYISGLRYLGKRFEPTKRQIQILEFHGILLVICWFYFIPIGIFVGRYMKETNRNYVLCGTRIWRFVHVMCMSMAGVLMLGALLCHIMGRIGWYNAGRNSFHVHSGWFVDLSVIVLMFTGCCLTKENETESFDYREFIHAFLGHISYIYGLFIIYFASTSSKFSRLPCSVAPLTIGWLVIYVFMQIPITLHYCWLDYLYCNGWGGISSSFFVFNKLTLRNNTTSDPPDAKFRVKLTLVFMVITFLYGSIVLCVVLAEKPCIGPRLAVGSLEQ